MQSILKVILMKNNIQYYHVSVRVASAALAVFVLFLSLCFPAFGYTDVSTNGVEFSPLPVLASGDTSSMVDVGSYPWSYGRREHLYCSAKSTANTPNPTVYAFTYQANSQYYLIMCSADRQQWSYYYSRYDNYGTPSYSSGNVTADFSSTTYTYSDSYVFSATPTLTDAVPNFSSLAAGKAAFEDFIENPPGPVLEPHRLTLSVPAGNCVYIDVTGVSTVRASLSMTSEVAHPQSWVSNQYYGFASSYPSSISGNPSGSSPIPWSGYGDKTLLNRYKTFSWSLTSVGNSDYLFICNPYATIDEYDQSFNPTIYITVQEAVGYKFYQLTGGIGADGTIGQQSDGTTASGTYDSDTESWTTTNDETGLPWTPQEGGGNIITQNSINSWLQQISTQIGNFFSGAIGAVTTLVSAGSDFIHSLSSLYSWLPSPVYAVLTSALILVITIGVIKVFI